MFPQSIVLSLGVLLPCCAVFANSPEAISTSVGQEPQSDGTPATAPVETPTAQDAPTKPIPEGLKNLPRVGSGPLLAVDKKPVAPGRIPEGTTPEAVQLWETLLKGTRAEEATAPVQPIRSFDMTFTARFREQSNIASNDADVRFLFLEEQQGYIRAVLESNRQTLRGPEGDWLFDQKQWVQIEGSRDDKESKRELDRWVAIARNFVALTQPKGIRLVELRALKGTPNARNPQRIDFDRGRFASFPNIKISELAPNLRWLEVTSPDFQLYDTGDQKAAKGKGGRKTVYRAMLGLNEKGLVSVAQFHEDVQGTNKPAGALFVYIKEWKQQPSGYNLPKWLFTYRQVTPERFETSPNLDLFLISKASRINPPTVTPATFVKPAE